MNSLALESALEMLRGAFKPYRTVAVRLDGENKVRLRVFGIYPIIRMENVAIDRVCNFDDLEQLIVEVRDRLKRKGCKLDAWNFPIARARG